MLINSLATPAILLDLNILERNLDRFQAMANDNNKQLWSMTKTHKSTQIARMQHARGATGFLCGTLDECEALASSGMNNISIMYAYPVASEPNIKRVIALANNENCKFYLRLDHTDQGRLINTIARSTKISKSLNYVVIINSGLNRFGIAPDEKSLHNFLTEMSMNKHFRFCGISTHPGHIYKQGESMERVVQDEAISMENAYRALSNIGYKPSIVSSGATPTFTYSVKNHTIHILHPENYVFMDYLQMVLSKDKEFCIGEADCALTVLATIISAPREGEFILDAGSKIFGEQGVHGDESIEGKGRVKNYPGLILDDLSEEVGKIKYKPGESADLKIGSIIEIIPRTCFVKVGERKYNI